MRSTKHNGLIAAALIMGLGAGLPAVANTTRRSSGSPAKPMRVVRKPPTEIEAWNADVDKRKAEKKARKALIKRLAKESIE